MSVPKGQSLFSSPTPSATVGGGERKLLEFQAVVLAGGDPALLHPVLEDKQCLALLPIANRPLLYYQLRALEKAGFQNCIVAVEESYRKAVNDYLAKAPFRIKVELFHPRFATDEQWESGTVLKQLSSLIFTDFLLLSGDLVSEASIHELADVHRTRDAAATMLLKENEHVDWKELRSTAPTFSYTAVQAEEVRTYYGLQQTGNHTSDHRVIMAKASEGDDGPCLIGRNLLVKCPQFVLHTNLSDAHLYIFKRWVLDILEVQSFASIKDDLLPYLIGIQHRQDFSTKHPELWAKAKSSQSLAQSMSSVARSSLSDDDRIRVYGFVTPYKKGGSVFIARAKSLEAYGWMSFAILDHPVSEMTPWDPFQSAKPVSSTPEEASSEVASMRSGAEKSVKPVKTLLGANCAIHPSASITRCIIGDGCVIGAHVKMRNCLILSGCRIEDDAQLENCLLGQGVVVQKDAKVNKCQVAPRYVVQSGLNLENMPLYLNANEDSDEDYSDK